MSRPAGVGVFRNGDLDCLLCGQECQASVDQATGDVLVLELCPRCVAGVQAAADRAASWVIQPARHNFEDVECGHPDSVGVFPVAGSVCPLCRPEVPGQLTVADAEECNGCMSDGRDACPEHRP